MWVVEDGKIKLSDVSLFPIASDIINSNESGVFVVNGITFPSPKSELNLRFSKILLDPRVLIDLVDDKIVVRYIVEKNGEEHVPTSLGYVIIDNVWYSLSSVFTAINDVLTELSINDLKDLSYTQYMNLIKACKENYISFEDLVQSKIRGSEKYLPDYLDYGLKAKLFDYQKDGANWITFMADNGCGCVLADEMGLGKTLQIITVLGRLKNAKSGKHFLIVAPVSLLENWRREFLKFFPSMKVLVHHGSKRTGSYLTLLQYDVIVTSYSNIQNDLSMFNMVEWDVMALDEAQNIKNPYAQRTKFIKQLRRKISIAITGTPFENHITDLWSIFDFVIPKYLGNLNSFEATFDDSVRGAQEIEGIISPLIIRRRVADVAKDLPEKVEIPQIITMTDEEAQYYESQRKSLDSKEALKVMTIDKIQGLRMFCTHPLVYNKNLSVKDPVLLSNKYERLVEILEEIFLLQEKAIIFTSFNSMIDIMVDDISKRFGVYTNFINGSTDVGNRQNIIDDFSKVNGPGVLVLNPRAAGVGLNITCANHVIHYNLEWNPAIEDQASARSYRRGQDKTVFVHRLFYADTIEEIINDRIERKREMSETAVVGTDGKNIEQEDILRALSISPIKEEN